MTLVQIKLPESPLSMQSVSCHMMNVYCWLLLSSSAYIWLLWTDRWCCWQSNDTLASQHNSLPHWIHPHVQSENGCAQVTHLRSRRGDAGVDAEGGLAAHEVGGAGGRLAERLAQVEAAAAVGRKVAAASCMRTGEDEVLRGGNGAAAGGVVGSCSVLGGEPTCAGCGKGELGLVLNPGKGDM